MVDDETERSVDLEIVQPAKSEAGFRLGVDGGVNALAMKCEATGHNVRSAVWGDGGQTSNSGVGENVMGGR